MDLWGKTLLGKYRIERLVGRGGMGTVWAAINSGTGRRVAIKILDERFTGNPSVAERFFREARAASAIRHRGIVDVLDLERSEEGVPFLVLEYLEGETLAQRVEREKRLSIDDAKAIVGALADAVGAAHEKGIVHRDIKPDNVVLASEPDGRPRVTLLDFGIAQVATEGRASANPTRGILGTPHYMSPEQARGDDDVDARADVYALGVVLYELVVGAVPFDAPDTNTLLQRIADGEPVPPSKRGVSVGVSLERLILRCLSKERDARPRNARELRTLLLEASDGGETWGEIETLGPRERKLSPPQAPKAVPRSVPLVAQDDELELASPAIELDLAHGLPNRTVAQSNVVVAAPEPTPPRPALPAVQTVPVAVAIRTVPRAVWFGAAAFLVLVAIVIAIRTLVRPGEGVSTEAVGQGLATTPSTVPTDLPQVDVAEITLTGLPPNYTLRVDGFPMTTMPVRMRARVAHTIDLDAPGYEPRRIVVTPTAAQTIAARMRRDTLP